VACLAYRSDTRCGDVAYRSDTRCGDVAYRSDTGCGAWSCGCDAAADVVVWVVLLRTWWLDGVAGWAGGGGGRWADVAGWVGGGGGRWSDVWRRRWLVMPLEPVGGWSCGWSGWWCGGVAGAAGWSGWRGLEWLVVWLVCSWSVW